MVFAVDREDPFGFLLWSVREGLKGKVHLSEEAQREAGGAGE